MNRGARLAIVVAIIIAVAGTATILAITTATPNGATPPANTNNSTGSKPRQFTVELNEDLSVEAK
ncbi:MAG TPA: hypothetical protein VNI77_02460 [Nitrososphaera sp.]|nr:hypothetical protein [Nitrososphaera sp.]